MLELFRINFYGVSLILNSTAYSTKRWRRELKFDILCRSYFSNFFDKIEVD